MNIALDTNVLVAGLLTPHGPCGDIVRLLVAGHLTLCVDARVLAEYDDVLRRPKFGLATAHVEALLEYIQTSSVVCAAPPLGESLPDPDDNPFLEVALASSADFLVTGNLRHYPSRLRRGTNVLSPRQWMDLRKERR